MIIIELLHQKRDEYQQRQNNFQYEYMVIIKPNSNRTNAKKGNMHSNSVCFFFNNTFFYRVKIITTINQSFI